MARPHAGRDAFLKYLNEGFPWKQPYISPPDYQQFSAEEVEEALKYVKIANPVKYKILDTTMTTRRSRAEIASSLKYDTSTVKRYLNQAVDLVIWYLRYKDLVSNKEFLDLNNQL